MVKKDLAFIHIPKNAGLTIEATLELPKYRYYHRARDVWNNEGSASFGHLNLRHCLDSNYVSKEWWDNAFKFCFCRNPYSRAISHWRYMLRKHPDVIPHGTSFVDFTRDLQKNYYHFRPQHTWLTGVEVDFIGRVENLEEDLRKVADFDELKTTNTTNHGPYWTYYCTESKERVEDFYKEDFKRFGYEYDNTLLQRQ